VPSAGWSSAFAVDGVRSANGSNENGWTSGAGPAGRSEWLQVDLDAADPTSQVDLYPRGDVPNGSVGFPSNVTIEGSNDGQAWTQLASGAGTAIAGSAARRFSFPASSFRYVKVTGSGFKADQFGGYYMQLGEVEIR
jgi:hypothetical protein